MNLPLIPREVLAARDRGFFLFPVKPREKSPLVKWPQAASRDLSQLEEWSLAFPHCNWGVVTGRRSGIFVVDVDGESGHNSLSRICLQQSSLPKTLQVITKRGFHSYFRLPFGGQVASSAGSLGSGLDVRGEGGYVVCPPSTHESGTQYAYKDASAAIAEAPEWLLRRVARIGKEESKFYKGNRNEMLTRIGGGLRRRGLSQPKLEAALLDENANRCLPRLPDSDVCRIARSLCRYDAGGPDVLALAWAKIEKAEFATTYEKVVELFRQLQRDLPGRPVALPLERIALHLGCDWTLVRRYRARAVVDGHLTLVKPYVYREKKAALYVVNL